jgi:hypothetical protein
MATENTTETQNEANNANDEESMPKSPLIVKANKKLALFSLAVIVLLGAGAAALIYFGSEKYVFKYSFYKYKGLVKVLSLGAFGAISLWGVYGFFKSLSRRLIFTERYIEDKRLLPSPSTETCDMGKVVDVTLRFSDFWTVSIQTKDPSSPLIEVKGMTEKEAKNLMHFIRHYAVSNYVEYRQMKQSEQKGKK